MTSIFLILFFVAGMPSTPPNSVENNPSSELEQTEKDLLAKGKVIILDKSGGKPKGKVRAAILIRAPVEEIWDVLVDCQHAPEFVPGLKDCKVLRSEGDTETIEHEVKFSWLIPKVIYTFRAKYQIQKQIDFKSIGGDLKEVEGSWVLESIGDGNQTILIYSVYLNPGFFIPQWLVNFTLRRNLPDLMKSVRDRVSEAHLQ
jgi:ribosome-associated toxin RatA of RatAB toxin-antitoxin module